MSDVQPVIFNPIYKPKIWGGDRIFRYLGRTPPSPEPIGESWELADLETDESIVRDGPWAGTGIGGLRDTWGRRLLGDAPLFQGRFPLLIKFLDAQQALSVQVHPSPAVARELGGNVRVKNEAWYILAAEPGAAIYHGLEPGVDAAAFREAMTTGRIEGVLRRVPVAPGQCHNLPSGTVHALGAGVLVAEVQTPSDITYRAYDWGRIDPSTQRPRALHLGESIRCIDFEAASPSSQQTVQTQRLDDGFEMSLLVACESFRIERWRIRAAGTRHLAGDTMMVWILLDGGGVLDVPSGGAVRFGKGDVLLLPAEIPGWSATFDGPTELLHVTVPAEGSV
jgi:mannose-6-phosphate isomerase